MARPVRLGRDLRDGAGDNLFGHVRVAMKVGDDHFERDVLVFLPAIVVGGHRQGGVGDFGFAGAFGLAQIGHADDVETGAMVQERFGAGAEGRAFHADIRAAVVRLRPANNGSLKKNLPQFFADRMREGDVRHDAASKKGVGERLFGAVHKLVNEHDVARLDFFLQRADGADTDDPGDTELFHRPDVGAMVEFAGHDPMAAPVTGKKNHVAPGELAGQQIVRRRAERGFDLHPFLVGEAFDVVKAGAADDADAMIGHARFIASARPKVASIFQWWGEARGEPKAGIDCIHRPHPPRQRAPRGHDLYRRHLHRQPPHRYGRNCAGPRSRGVLMNPLVEAAVFETARGGILREGLGFDRCDVAVVTNIGEGDHLGLNEVHTVETLAKLKRCIVNVVPPGWSVLNANDPHCVASGPYSAGRIYYFGAGPFRAKVLSWRRVSSSFVGAFFDCRNLEATFHQRDTGVLILGFCFGFLACTLPHLSHLQTLGSDLVNRVTLASELGFQAARHLLVGFYFLFYTTWILGGVFGFFSLPTVGVGLLGIPFVFHFCRTVYQASGPLSPLLGRIRLQSLQLYCALGGFIALGLLISDWF